MIAEPRNAELRRKFSINKTNLARRFPELHESSGSDNDDLRILGEILTARIAMDQDSRLDRWIWRMETNERDVAAWISSRDTSECPVNPTHSVHPQVRVEEEATKFSNLWRPSTLPDTNALDDLIRDWAPEGGFSCVNWEVSGSQLQSRAKLGAASSASCDEWTLKQVALLP